MDLKEVCCLESISVKWPLLLAFLLTCVPLLHYMDMITQFIKSINL